MTASVAGRDFFISYAADNRPWAEWIAVELERAGYTTVMQTFDFRPGTDFVHQMQEAASTAGQTIAVLSPAYFVSDFGEAEWRAAFVKDPTGELGLLIPVRVQPVNPPGLLASRVYVDLVDVADESAARTKLLAAVDPDRPRPVQAAFPGGRRGSARRFPGLGPEVSNLPGRNVAFSGRDDDLQRVHAALRTATPPTVAVHGLGGVGKTQVAVEYGHRFSSDYDLIWWITAERTTSVWTGLAALAHRLGVAVAPDQADTIAALFDELRGRGRWLLIYDNAVSPRQLTAQLPPGGAGHVLITSRWSAWSSKAAPVSLSVWTRPESLAYLRHRSNATDDMSALDELADLLGDLPLALDEAATYLDETKAGVDRYRDLLRERAGELFGLNSHGLTDDDDRRIATVWSVSLDEVRRQEPAAEALLDLLAFLDPHVPRALPAERTDLLPAALAVSIADPLGYDRLIRVLGTFSLVDATPRELTLHRLVQTVIRARLDGTAERTWAAAATDLLRHTFPAASDDPAMASECERLLPHLEAATDHARRLNVAGQQTGWLLERAADYLREQRRFLRAKKLIDDALTVTKGTLGAGHPDVASRREHRGRLLVEMGELDLARSEYECAVDIIAAALGADHPQIVGLRQRLANVLLNIGDLDSARDQLNQALRIGGAVPGTLHRDLGTVQLLSGDVAGALAQFQLAIRIDEDELGPDHPDIGALRNNLGSALQQTGDLTAAREQFELALRISEAALGPDHPDVGVRLNNLGSVLESLGDLAGARERYEQALRISEAALGPDHPDIAVRHNNLGGVLQDMGDLTAARAHTELAVRIGEATLGPDHPNLAMWRYNFGRVLRDLGQSADALDQFDQALRISTTAFGPDNSLTPVIRAAREDPAATGTAASSPTGHPGLNAPSR